MGGTQQRGSGVPVGNALLQRLQYFEGVVGVGGTGSLYAPINSPEFTGIPTVPTAPLGTNTGQIASTAWVNEEIGWFNVRSYGATGNGSTDDSAAIQACINACAAAGGGTVYFPNGTYLCLSQLYQPVTSTIAGSYMASPYDVYLSNPIHLVGQSVNMTPGGGSIPTEGAILKFDVTSPTWSVAIYGSSTNDYPMVVCLGQGLVEIDHLQIQDGSTSHNWLIFSNNAVVKIHDNLFVGNLGAPSCHTDGIVLGSGSSNSDPSGGSSSPSVPNPGTTTTGIFQGYGSVIRDNACLNMRVVVLCQNEANEVDIRDNQTYATCGSDGGGVGVAPIVLWPNINQSLYGCRIEGNDLELYAGYEFGVALIGPCYGNIVGNPCSDPFGTPYLFDVLIAGGVGNTVTYQPTGASQSRICHLTNSGSDYATNNVIIGSTFTYLPATPQVQIDAGCGGNTIIGVAGEYCTDYSTLPNVFIGGMDVATSSGGQLTGYLNSPVGSGISSPGAFNTSSAFAYTGPGVTLYGGHQAIVFVQGTIVPSSSAIFGMIGFEYSSPGTYQAASNTMAISFDANTATTSAGFSGTFFISFLNPGLQTFYIGCLTIGGTVTFDYLQITVIPLF